MKFKKVLKENEDDKYYVFGMGWQGKEHEWLINNLDQADFVVDTYDEALEKVDELYNTVLESDESAYVVHNGKVVYEEG